MIKIGAYKKINNASGFTLVEIIVVISIFAALTSLTIFSFRTPQQNVTVDAYLTTLISDLKQQQFKSMIGETEGSISAKIYGIKFEENKYTAFSGSIFSSSDINNFTVSLKNTVITTNLPGNQIIFSKITGEVVNFDPVKNTVSLKSAVNNDRKNFSINRYGVINIIK